MKYHIQIDLKDNSAECRIDMDEPELLDEYIRPYLRQEKIMIKGRSIPSSNIYRLKISESENSIEPIVENIILQDKYDRDPYSIFNSSPEWRAIDTCKEVTDKFLKSSKTANLTNSNTITLPIINKSVYVNNQRIGELSKITNSNFDFVKLIQLCNEINIAWQLGNYFSVIALLRTTLHHISPIFGFKDFAQVASNYSGGQSFKKSMQHLLNSSKNIADNHLHSQIKNKDSLPNDTQVDYRNDLDFLLMEIINITK